jgi:hypothetical protein
MSCSPKPSSLEVWATSDCAAPVKGVLHLCEGHDGYSGDPIEGYFTCEDCQRVIVDHYTWEQYQIEYDGATLCLKCAAERYFTDDYYWLDPRQVKAVVLKPGATLFDRASGTLNLAACRHVLGVSQPRPEASNFWRMPSLTVATAIKSPSAMCSTSSKS